jgi:hypothetical protein
MTGSISGQGLLFFFIDPSQAGGGIALAASEMERSGWSRRSNMALYL